MSVATASKKDAPNLNDDLVGIPSDSEFMKELESVVNEGTGSQQTPEPEKSGKDSEGNDKKVTELEKRYSDSSREAKRLKGELEKLEPLKRYQPILDAFENDPQLVEHVKGYYEDGGQAPKDIKQKLGLPEDFVYDADEAMSDPKSDSAKLLQSTMKDVVGREVNKAVQSQTAVQKQEAEESSFKKEHDMSDDEFKEFIDWTKKTPMTLENMYILKNLQSRDKKIASQAKKDIQTQMENVRRSPRSLSNAGSEEEQKKSPEVELFSAMLKLDQEKNNIFD